MSESWDQAYQILLWVSTIFLSLSICACLIRAILGPRLTDRIVAINVICTKVVILIAIMSRLFDKSSMLDIAIVYAMISFLAMVVLSKCYLQPDHANLTNPAPRSQGDANQGTPP
ncbi:MAG: monovalent cation/H+ antiporter complex subunit F [Treponema sp.]|nr:monovalent cation/H+ antiporter complex subunit F [Treponema sp.]